MYIHIYLQITNKMDYSNKQVVIKGISTADKKKISQSMSWVLRHEI